MNIIRRFKERSRNVQYKITCYEHGIQIKDSAKKNEIKFSWDSVLSVDVFKRDLFIVDCICMLFQTDKEQVEINEDMEGWDDLLKKAELNLANFPAHETWIGEVMLPAFETKYSRIWTKKRG